MTTARSFDPTIPDFGSVTRPLRRTWGWVLADGIVGIVAGVLALLWPGIAVLTLAVLLGIVLMLQGIAQLAAGWAAQEGMPGRAWLVVFGLLALAAGVICLVRPGVGLTALVVGLAVWFFAAGVNEFVTASASRQGRVWNIVVGLLSVVAGAAVLTQPQAGLSTVALIVGVAFVVRGIGETTLAVKIRSFAAPRGHYPPKR